MQPQYYRMLRLYCCHLYAPLAGLSISISDHPDLLYFQCERHRSLAVIAEKDSGLLMMYVVTA